MPCNFCYKLLHWMFIICLVKCLVKIIVTRKVCPLPNVSAISDDTEGKINDFCMMLTIKW